MAANSARTLGQKARFGMMGKPGIWDVLLENPYHETFHTKFIAIVCYFHPILAILTLCVGKNPIKDLAYQNFFDN